MVSREELLDWIKEAVELEESFLPEIGYLMKQRLLEYRLPEADEEKALELLKTLEEQSMNHYNLLKEAFERVKSSDADEY